MNMEKFDEASRKVGGRLKATAVIQKRLKELVSAGPLKDKTVSDAIVDRILDEIITEQISIKEGTLECEVIVEPKKK